MGANDGEGPAGPEEGPAGPEEGRDWDGKGDASAGFQCCCGGRRSFGGIRRGGVWRFGLERLNNVMSLIA